MGDLPTQLIDFAFDLLAIAVAFALVMLAFFSIGAVLFIAIRIARQVWIEFGDDVKKLLKRGSR